jgi:hypothetical protein
MKFLAVSIAAIFLSVSASTAETTNSPISSQLAATPKAGKKISSKVRENSPRAYAPTRGMTNAEHGAALVGPNAWGLVATRLIAPRAWHEQARDCSSDRLRRDS